MCFHFEKSTNNLAKGVETFYTTKYRHRKVCRWQKSAHGSLWCTHTLLIAFLFVWCLLFTVLYHTWRSRKNTILFDVSQKVLDFGSRLRRSVYSVPKAAAVLSWRRRSGQLKAFLWFSAVQWRVSVSDRFWPASRSPLEPEGTLCGPHSLGPEITSGPITPPHPAHASDGSPKRLLFDR